MKKLSIIYLAAVCLYSQGIHAQDKRPDSLFFGKDSVRLMDSIFKDLDFFLDSLTASRSLLNVNIGAANGFYNFKSANSVFLQAETRLVLSPTIMYFHKSGLGLSVTGYGINDNNKFNFYQLAVSPTYDYMRNRHFSLSFSFAHYFTKDSLSFYTTPVTDEFYFNFLWKQWPVIQEGIAVCYGWGSNTSYEKRSTLRRSLLARRRGVVTIKTVESVQDVAISFYVRHDFDIFHLFNRKDLFRITPQLALNTGTQNFGLNTSYSSESKIINNLLPSNSDITDNRGLGLQSTSFTLRADYTMGKFFLLPQVLVDYYLPQTDLQRLHVLVAVSAGINL